VKAPQPAQLLQGHASNRTKQAKVTCEMTLGSANKFPHERSWWLCFRDKALCDFKHHIQGGQMGMNNH
jgi:hypothetical protein